MDLSSAQRNINNLILAQQELRQFHMPRILIQTFWQSKTGSMPKLSKTTIEKEQKRKNTFRI